MVKTRWIPDRSEIIWINYNPQAGREIRDMHSMMVLSPKKFNDRTGIVIGLPMTSAEYNNTNPFAVRFKGKRGITSYVLAHQPKSFDWRKRFAKRHPWKKVPHDVLTAACELLNQIIVLTE